jgi:predicted RNase H-like HicB family nuclease
MVKHVELKQLSDDVLASIRRYAIVIEWSDDDQLFLASLPDFPGAHTHGRTRAEALEMGEEVLALLLDGNLHPPPARFSALSYPIRPEAEALALAGSEQERQ